MCKILYIQILHLYYTNHLVGNHTASIQQVKNNEMGMIVTTLLLDGCVQTHHTATYDKNKVFSISVCAD